METSEILYELRSIERNKRSYARMIISYILYDMGYRTTHIAKALKIHRMSVDYAVINVREMLRIKDEKMSYLYNRLKDHTYRLEPYFEQTDALYSVGAHLVVDNIKL